MQFIMEILILPNLTILVPPPPPPSSNPYPHQSHRSNSKPMRPCSLCTYKNFDASHYTLSKECGVRKLSSADIIKIMDITRSCPSCGNGHAISFQCRTTFDNNESRFCTKGCKHNGYPLHYAACKHHDETPSYTVSKVGSDRSIPLVENIYLGSTSVGIQYDTGCQLSLISRSALQTLPTDMYSIEEPTKVGIIPYAGDDETILTTEIQLKLKCCTLQLYVFEDTLNNTSPFSILPPTQWRACTGGGKLSHTGRISILLGVDNFLAFPKEIDRDRSGLALFKSTLTNKHLICGRANLSKIIPQATHSQGTPRYQPHPEPLLPRVQRQPQRGNSPRNTCPATSFKPKPNLNRPPAPVVDSTYRKYGRDNTATAHKDWEQRPDRITQLLRRRNSDIYGAQIQKRREIGGRLMSVNRHLHNIFPFMDVETTVPEEVVTGLQPDDAVGITAPGSSRSDVQDEIVSD